MRIGIINDTVMATETLRRIISSVSGYEVVWVAKDGAQGVKQCQQDTPDLVLMDMIMPVIDGVQATRQIMQLCPCAILIVTSSVQRHSSMIFEAMGYGALDVVSTPIIGHLGNPAVAQSLLQKIATIGVLTGKNSYPTQRIKSSLSQSPISGTLLPPDPTLPPSLIVIGASTGGPKALAKILSQLPSSIPAAIVIIQHVDIQFALGLSKWLNNQTPLPVQLATEGSRPELGKVLLAGTNDHLRLRSNLTLTYSKDPQHYPYRPSVDVFCNSVAQHWHRKGIGVILTGMGRDGAEGLGQLRSKGWHTIAQDQATCVVYGMPKAAVEIKAVEIVLPLNAIASALLKRLTVNG